MDDRMLAGVAVDGVFPASVSVGTVDLPGRRIALLVVEAQVFLSRPSGRSGNLFLAGASAVTSADPRGVQWRTAGSHRPTKNAMDAEYRLMCQRLVA